MKLILVLLSSLVVVGLGFDPNDFMDTEIHSEEVAKGVQLAVLHEIDDSQNASFTKVSQNFTQFTKPYQF